MINILIEQSLCLQHITINQNCFFKLIYNSNNAVNHCHVPVTVSKLKNNLANLVHHLHGDYFRRCFKGWVVPCANRLGQGFSNQANPEDKLGDIFCSLFAMYKIMKIRLHN